MNNSSPAISNRPDIIVKSSGTWSIISCAINSIVIHSGNITKAKSVFAY